MNKTQLKKHEAVERRLAREAAKPAELGAKDGAKFAKKYPKKSPEVALFAANQSGLNHLRHVEAGRLTVADVVTYCQAYLNAALKE